MPPPWPGQVAQTYDTAIANAQMPPEGPKALACQFLFTATQQTFTQQMYLTSSQQYMSQVQGAFVDNSENSEPVFIKTEVLGQVVKFPAASQGYIPLLCPFKANIDVSSAVVNPALVTIFFLNVPVPALIWEVDDGAADDLKTSHVVLVAATATLILAANPDRTSLVISGQAGNIFIGSSNAVTAANGLEVATGQTFNTSAQGQYQGAIWGISTAGDTVTVAEFS